MENKLQNKLEVQTDGKRQKMWTLEGHFDLVTRLCWSPNGKFIISAANDKTLRIWDVEIGRVKDTLPSPFRTVTNLSWSPAGDLLAASSIYESIYLMGSKSGIFQGKLTEHEGWISSVAWSPDSEFIATTCADQNIRIWIANKCHLLKTIKGHKSMLKFVLWSPDGTLLASASTSGNIILWKTGDWSKVCVFPGHTDSVNYLAWSPDGSTLASSSSDGTIRLWAIKKKKCVRLLKVQDRTISCIDFSSDGNLFATMNEKGSIVLWDCNTWKVAEKFVEPYVGKLRGGLAFHPSEPIISTVSGKKNAINVWNLEELISCTISSTVSIGGHITAKVLFVNSSDGDLAKEVNSKDICPVSTLAKQSVKLTEEQSAVHEMVLWDLTNCPSSKSFYLLHMTDVACVVILYNAFNNDYNFDGVRQWNETLQTMQSFDNNKSLELKKFVIILNRQPKDVDLDIVGSLVNELRLDGYFIADSKNLKDVENLPKTIHDAIKWEKCHKTSFPMLLNEIKNFLISQKSAGRLLSNIEDLYSTFASTNDSFAGIENLREQFYLCIRHIDATGIIRYINLGGMVLFNTELLNSYVSSILKKAKNNPNGLGNVLEEDVKAGRFNIPLEHKLKEKEREKLLLVGTIEEMIHSKMAMRETTENGLQLIFPSQIKYKTPDFDGKVGNNVVVRFKGAISNVFAALSVSISYSGIFQKKDIWRNAVVFTTKYGGTYGVLLGTSEPGTGDIVLFYSPDSKPELRQRLEKLVRTHLERLAIPDSIECQSTSTCSNCGEVISERIVKRRQELGHTEINCPVCDTPISLFGSDDNAGITSNIPMHRGNEGGGFDDVEVASTKYQNIGVLRALDNYRPGAPKQTERPSAMARSTLSRSKKREEPEYIAVKEELDSNQIPGMHAGKDAFKNWAGSEKCTLAIAFTDIIGSSQLGNKLGNSAFSKLRQAHFAEARRLLKKYNGYEIKTIGDSVMAAFRTVSEVLDFALDFYVNTGDPRVKIRVGIHVGPVSIEHNDAFGITVNYTARVESMAKGAEIWLSNEAKTHIDQEGLEHHLNLEWKKNTGCELKGFEGTFTLWSVNNL